MKHTFENFSRKLVAELFKLIFHNQVASLPLSIKNTRKVLIIKRDKLGDMALTTACFNLLKSLDPEIKIDLLTSRVAEEIVRCDSRLSERFIDEKTFWKRVKLTLELRKKKYDLIISLAFGGRSTDGLIANFISSDAVKATYFLHEERAELYSTLFHFQVPFDSQMFIAERQTNIITHLFGLENVEARTQPSLMICSQSEQKAKRFLTQQMISDFVLLNLSASADFKEWLGEEPIRFLQLYFQNPQSMPVILIASSKDEAFAQSLLEISKKKLFYYGGSVQDIMAMTQYASIAISPDTAVGHFAASFQRPVVSLCTRYTTRPEWHVYKTKSVVLYPDGNKFVRTITAEMVFEAVCQMISENAEGKT